MMTPVVSPGTILFCLLTVSVHLEKKKGNAAVSLSDHDADHDQFAVMPRTARYAPGGLVYHVLNRAVARGPLFTGDGDYEAFLWFLAEAHRRCPSRLLSHCGRRKGGIQHYPFRFAVAGRM